MFLLDSSESCTVTSTGLASSEPLAVSVENATSGGSSSSWMVTVCTVPAPRMPCDGFVRVRRTVSSTSSTGSFVSVTGISCDVSPASNVRVPAARV